MAHYALKKQPRTTARALSDTVVTRADGSQYVIPKTPAPSADTLAARERLSALKRKQRERERANARIDAINAIDARKPRLQNFNLETIHEPRGW